jgi:2-polyprenyl-3-methyl-5-hydroxy-6-metoxy-1,4-benzoquinol methylase
VINLNLTKIQNPKHLTLSLTDKLCPLCARDEFYQKFTFLYIDKVISILECKNCAHIFVHPLPTYEEDRLSTCIDEEEGIFKNKLLEFVYIKFILQREVVALKKIFKNKSTSKLLDIACGTGFITSVWQKNGFDVVGLEPSRLRGEYAKKKYGLNVFIGYLEDYSSPQKFDCITMRHILEHVPDPVTMLKKVHDLLNEDGILLITLPNINCIGRYMFQEHWEWVLPSHIHFFKPKTLHQLIDIAGFERISFFQAPTPLYYPAAIRKTFQNNKNFTKIWDRIPLFVKMIFFLPIIFVGVILNANDNMTMICRKKSNSSP